MRAPPLVLALTVLGYSASASSRESDAIKQLKACFQLDRAARAECFELLSKELPNGDPVGSLPPAASNWVVSETTSPVDYSPIVTATTQSRPGAKDAPDAPSPFAVAGNAPTSMVSTEGSWRASRNQ